MSSDGGQTAAGPGAKVALVVLVTLAVLSPWATGSVDPPAVRAITLGSLTTAIVALVLDARRGEVLAAPIALWPLAGLWLVGVGQLVPLPPAVHSWIAPGSAAVWHPDTAAAAAVLGSDPRPISIYPDATRRTLAFGTGVLALALAAAPALRDHRLLLRACVAIVTGATAVSLYAIVARLVFGSRLYGIWAVPTVAPFGPFVNKNHFAGYVEQAACLALGLAIGLASEARRGRDWLSWIESRRARYVVLAFGATAILVLAVTVSLSRGGVVSLCCGVGALVLLRLVTAREATRARVLLAAAGAAALLLVALVTVLPDEARARLLTLTGVTTEESGSFRLTVWRDSARLSQSSPWLGSGLGTFEDAFRRFKTGAGDHAVQHAESDWVELGAEGGLAGMVLVLAAVGLLFTGGLRGAAKSSAPLVRGLVTGAIAGLVALAVHSAFDFNLRIPSNALIATTLASVVLSATSSDSTFATRGRRWLGPPPAIALTLVLTLLTPVSPQTIGGATLIRAGHAGGSTLRHTSLDSEIRSHLERRPADPVAWLVLAWLRAANSTNEAAGLSARAANLDPLNRAVQDARARLDATSPH
jgi:O-antigen ligase